jgi:hypothetical protein
MGKRMVETNPRHLPRRSVLGFLVAIGARPLDAKAAGCAPPSVLFVCPYGTVKSAIAREMLKRRARERGVAVHAWSRGLRLENHVSPALGAKLAADGLDPAAEPAQTLRPADVGSADLVVAFDEAADDPALRGARAWPTPSWNDDYAGAKAAVSARIDALLDEVASLGCGTHRPAA